MDKVDWSKAPEGTKYAAWRKGTVKPMLCWYSIINGGWHYWYEEDTGPWSPCADGSPAHKPLEKRPQPDHKEGEGVEWEPGVDLPPVGVECEREGDPGKWFPVIPKIYSNGKVCCMAESNNGVLDALAIFRADPTKFRPIQSHRDKVIEAAETECGGIVDTGAVIRHLYEIGMLVYPGDDQ